MIDKTLLLQKLTQNAPKLAANLKNSLQFNNTDLGKEFSENAFKSASEALNRGYDMSLLNDSIHSLPGPDPITGEGFDFDLNMDRNLFPTDVYGKYSLRTPASQSAQSLKQFLPLTNPNIPASSMSKMFDVLKNVKPEHIDTLQYIDDIRPEMSNLINDAGHVINTALNNGYDPGLIAQDMNIHGGFPSGYLKGNTVEFPSDMASGGYEIGMSDASDEFASMFPAQASAQAFLPNKPNKSWRRPPGDFSIDTFYEDDFGQTPRR